MYSIYLHMCKRTNKKRVMGLFENSFFGKKSTEEEDWSIQTEDASNESCTASNQDIGGSIGKLWTLLHKLSLNFMQTIFIGKNFHCVRLDRDFEIVNLCGKYLSDFDWSTLSCRNLL